jgi:dihydroorotate dehydrogenase
MALSINSSGSIFLSSLFFWLGRSLLFLLPAELSHDLGLKGLRFLHQFGLIGLLRPKVQALPLAVFGLQFTNPVGLAAGLDKNADYIDALGALGFGFIEVGTITPKPQPGNPQPRLFRLRKEHAIINRMGFNNKGVDHLVEQLKRRRYQGVVGVNIGKNLTTAVENAAQDYVLCLQKVYPHADYVVVNLSSPNTPGLRSLQFGVHLDQLLAALKAEQQTLAEVHQRQVPMLLKIAPDLTSEEIISIAQSLRKYALDGVIATNTTLSRKGVEGSVYAAEAGGLSGAPLTAAATSVLAQLAKALNGTMPIIGVGGIMHGADAAARLSAGATLVQLYSGFIFAGPPLIRDAAAACKHLQDVNE